MVYCYVSKAGPSCFQNNLVYTLVKLGFIFHVTYVTHVLYTLLVSKAGLHIFIISWLYTLVKSGLYIFMSRRVYVSHVQSLSFQSHGCIRVRHGNLT